MGHNKIKFAWKEFAETENVGATDSGRKRPIPFTKRNALTPALNRLILLLQRELMLTGTIPAEFTLLAATPDDAPLTTGLLQSLRLRYDGTDTLTKELSTCLNFF